MSQSPVRRCAADDGMVTAETAVVLPVLVLVVAILLGVIGHAVDEIRAVDAAESGARAAARGETELSVEQAVKTSAPRGSDVHVTRQNGEVTVDVVTPQRSLFGLLDLPSAHAQAVTVVEYTVTS